MNGSVAQVLSPLHQSSSIEVEETSLSQLQNHPGEDNARSFRRFGISDVARVARQHLEYIYKHEFCYSESYRELVITLHDNVIEFDFLNQAGLIRVD